MPTMTQTQTARESAASIDPEYRRFRYLRVAFWIIAGVTGFLQIWSLDHIIWADTLSYLDSGDLLWRGDFANAITNHWSPGYPFLLGLALKILHPVGFWEVAVVKLVDMIDFLFAVGGFDFFVNQFCRYHERYADADNRGTKLMVPRVALASIAYMLFLWATATLLPAWNSTPDTLLMGIVFLAFGLLLKIRMGANGFRSFAILGVVLGFGYLIKAPMFPVAVMFMGIAFLLVGDLRKAVPRILLCLGIFALIAAPLVIRLSELAGGLTFGKSGAWNYARTVNGIALPYHWHGQPPGTGTPLHPTRIIFEAPTVYEFGSPVKGTFPPWRDPYYWYEGITPHFDLHGQWRVIKGSARILVDEMSDLNKGFIYGFLILLLMSSDPFLIGKSLARQWFLLLPAIAILAMYSLVLIEGRYIAPYPVLIGLVVFSCVAVVRSASSVKLVNVTVLLAAILFAVSSAKPAESEIVWFARSLHPNEILARGGPWHASTQAVSDDLRAHGVQRGDRVAYIGASGDFYWARLAGVRVNAEIRGWGQLDQTVHELVPHSTDQLERSVDVYWASSPETKESVDRVLYKAGSKVIVTDAFPAGGDTNGWDQVPGTSYYIHLLSDSTGGGSK